jgi:hypothetical protein
VYRTLSRERPAGTAADLGKVRPAGVSPIFGLSRILFRGCLTRRNKSLGDESVKPRVKGEKAFISSLSTLEFFRITSVAAWRIKKLSLPTLMQLIAY